MVRQKELKKLTVKREICEGCSNVIKEVKDLPNTASYNDIVETADSIYNEKIDMFDAGQDLPVNIFDDMEDVIEERGNNPAARKRV